MKSKVSPSSFCFGIEKKVHEWLSLAWLLSKIPVSIVGSASLKSGVQTIPLTSRESMLFDERKWKCRSEKLKHDKGIHKSTFVPSVYKHKGGARSECTA